MAEKNLPQYNITNVDQPESNVTSETKSDSDAASKDNATKPVQTSKHANTSQSDDIGIVIVDDDMHVDQEKINEERRAYLEEARSQEVSD